MRDGHGHVPMALLPYLCVELHSPELRAESWGRLLGRPHVFLLGISEAAAQRREPDLPSFFLGPLAMVCGEAPSPARCWRPPFFDGWPTARVCSRSCAPVV